MPRVHRVPEPTATANVLGVDVDGWTPDALVQAMVASATGALPPDQEPLRTVLYANPHVLNLAYGDVAVRHELLQASTVICDGSGVRLAARLLGEGLPPRLAAADWIHPLCDAASEAGVSLFLLGGRPGVAEEAARRLRLHSPGLRVAGTHHGYLSPELSEGVIQRANESGAHLMLVGMGSPTQELWIGRHRDRIRAPVVWAAGAVMDFVAGVQRRAPAPLRRLHLEWLWRLATDPRRLGRRYILGNPTFVARVLRQRLEKAPPASSSRPDG